MKRNESIIEIDRIINEYRRANPRGARKQYPASKAQIARLTELGLLDSMPMAPFSRNIGYTEAELAIKAAETGPSAVFNAYGEGEATGPSALWRALNETDGKPEGSGEVVRYIIDAETYIVTRDGDAYAVDAEWSDGPAAIFDHLPSAAEVEDVHRAALGALAADDALRQLEEVAAAEKETRQLEADAAAAEKALAWDFGGERLLTVEEAARLKGVHPEALRRLIRAGEVSARSVGAGGRKVWLLSEAVVAAWTPRPVGRPRRDSQ